MRNGSFRDPLFCSVYCFLGISLFLAFPILALLLPLAESVRPCLAFIFLGFGPGLLGPTCPAGWVLDWCRRLSSLWLGVRCFTVLGGVGALCCVGVHNRAVK